jgi:ribose transport system permease protein
MATVTNPAARHRRLRVQGWSARLRLDRLAGLYVWLILIAFFAFAAPNSFPTTLTLKTTLADNSVTGLLALGALVPFAAGLIDLSFAGIAGLSLVAVTWLSIHTGLPGPAIAVIAILSGSACGLGSGLFITRLGVNSLVVTLGVSTVALGLSELVSAGNTLTAQWSTSFQNIGQGYVWVFPLPALYLLVVAIAVYYVIEHTPIGRRVLATGSNPSAARLAGLRTARIHTLSLVVSGAVAGLVGIVLATQIGVATTETGPGFLLPAVAALFLGETQIRARVNVWGTVLAVFLIGTGIKGLELMGAAPWVNDFFNGAVLLLAVGVAARARKHANNQPPPQSEERNQ